MGAPIVCRLRCGSCNLVMTWGGGGGVGGEMKDLLRVRRNPPGALWCLMYTPAVARRLIAGLIPAPPFPLLSSALLLLLLLPL